MKKLLALVLAVLMMLSLTPAMADDDGNYTLFDLTVTGKFVDNAGLSAQDWDTDYERATLSTLLILDYMIATGLTADDIDITNSYLGYMADDDIFLVLVAKGDGAVMIMFHYESKLSAYTEGDVSVELVASVSDFADANFIKNSKTEIEKVLVTIQDALED